MKKIISLVITTLLALSVSAQTYPPKDTPELEFALQLRVTLGEVYSPGMTQHGKRTVIPITGGTFEGDLEVAKFDDTFKKNFLGYIQKGDGGLACVKNATKPKVYIAFQVEGDSESRRIIMYNCALGGITREYATEEESIEPATETIAVTVAGDNSTGISMVSYNQATTGYSTLFTNPPAPTTT